MPSKIGVVGAGPAGLTFALACARHPTKDVEITVFEREEDHMTAPRYNPDRSYTIDITGHGHKALQYCEATQVFDDNLIPFKGIHLRRPVDKSDPWTEPGWTGSRGDICRALLSELSKYDSLVKVEFDTTVTITDIFTGKMTTQKKDAGAEESTWDLIVGCDGAGAVTRNALKEQLPGFEVQSFQNGNYCSMIAFDPEKPKTKELDASCLEGYWHSLTSGQAY
jgi:2-polyprenyl-6-methoxyphenol hydroxylase-like FAD-dependent oxidoreductase